MEAFLMMMFCATAAIVADAVFNIYCNVKMLEMYEEEEGE
jgi:hypothetical protein